MQINAAHAHTAAVRRRADQSTHQSSHIAPRARSRASARHAVRPAPRVAAPCTRGCAARLGDTAARATAAAATARTARNDLAVQERHRQRLALVRPKFEQGHRRPDVPHHNRTVCRHAQRGRHESRRVRGGPGARQRARARAGAARALAPCAADAMWNSLAGDHATAATHAPCAESVVFTAASPARVRAHGHVAATVPSPPRTRRPHPLRAYPIAALRGPRAPTQSRARRATRRAM